MRNRLLRAMRAALVCALVFAMSGTGALAASISVRINSNARVYKSASTSSRSVKVRKNLRVTLKAYRGGWGRISYRGRTGYIKLKYLDRVNPVRAYAAGKATVYRSAGSGRVGTISRGTTVYIVGVNGSYARVRNASGTAKGYIKASQLTGRKPSAAKKSSGKTSSAASAVPASLRATSKSKGNKIEYTIYVAQNLIGKPYAANANPPKTFDCAKFAYYCYGAAKSGCLQGSSRGQGYDDRYKKISYSDLKRGDLVCFDTVEDNDLCDHVGVYLGKGYFIHASSAAKKVILSNLSSGYYNRTFSWGRRIFS